jgi:hypothetical protein
MGEWDKTADRMCKSKNRYTLKEARTMRNRKERYRYKKGELRIYQCPICDGYHLTHTKLDNGLDIE